MFKLPDLPYPHDALEPTISTETMRLHHDKHHAKYVETTNQLMEKEGLAAANLEDLVRQARLAGKTKLFNNAGQAWNHAFFWSCMTPSRSDPDGALAEAIGSAFGGLDGLKAAFVDEGVNHFGSGWVWLTATAEGLKVDSTHDGDNHLLETGDTPLLTCDLWEHAYYVDYRNDRKGFLEAWFDRVVDWRFAAAQLAAHQNQGPAWRYPEPGEEPLRRQA